MSLSEVSFEYFKRNHINLARAFLGKDGGFSVRRLKKFWLRDRQARQEEKEERMRKREERMKKQEGGAAAAGGEVKKEEEKKAEPKKRIVDEFFSDESEDEYADKMDNTEVDKVLDELS